MLISQMNGTKTMFELTDASRRAHDRTEDHATTAKSKTTTRHHGKKTKSESENRINQGSESDLDEVERDGLSLQRVRVSFQVLVNIFKHQIESSLTVDHVKQSEAETRR